MLLSLSRSGAVKVCGISNNLDGSENALVHFAKELPAFTIPAMNTSSTVTVTVLVTVMMKMKMKMTKMTKNLPLVCTFTRN